MPAVLVPPPRLLRWLDNFAHRHGQTSLAVTEGGLAGTAGDGSSFSAVLPFGRPWTGGPDAVAFVEACEPPHSWGVLLVRKGGFAVARLQGGSVVESKVGQRHVQGRTKAGGQSQQRFARRRDNQARTAFEAAAEHAARILPGAQCLGTGGDHQAVEAVLSDRRLSGLRVVPPFLTVPDPRRAVLDQAIVDAGSVRIDVTNA